MPRTPVSLDVEPQQRLARRLTQHQDQISTLQRKGQSRIKGRINSSGTILLGAGFSCVRTALGRYTITLGVAMPNEGIFNATLVGASSGQIRLASGVNTTTFAVESLNIPQSEFQDNTFNFTIDPL